MSFIANRRSGLARDEIYLLRPDTYVALAETSGDPKVLERYFTDRTIRLFTRPTQQTP